MDALMDGGSSELAVVATPSSPTQSPGGVVTGLYLASYPLMAGASAGRPGSLQRSASVVARLSLLSPPKKNPLVGAGGGSGGAPPVTSMVRTILSVAERKSLTVTVTV